VLRRLLPVRVLVSVGVAFAIVGGIVAAGALFRDRHGRPHGSVVVPTTAPAPGTTVLPALTTTAGLVAPSRAPTTTR
jgi:hypothetical protein